MPPPSCASGARMHRSCWSGAGRIRRMRGGGDVCPWVGGREPDPPYERPPLSKEYVRGEAKREDAYVNQASWYEENGVELRTETNVMALDVEARTGKPPGGG